MNNDQDGGQNHGLGGNDALSTMAMAPSQDSGPTNPRMNDVRLEDQEKINLFSRFNIESKELQGKIDRVKRSLEDLEDAGNEILLMDDERVPFVIGECFVRIPQEEAETRIDELSEVATKELEELQSRRAVVEAEMKGLKKSLYDRFGNSIHLEDE